MVLCGRESDFAHEGEHRFALRPRRCFRADSAGGAHVAAYDTPTRYDMAGVEAVEWLTSGDVGVDSSITQSVPPPHLSTRYIAVSPEQMLEVAHSVGGGDDVVRPSGMGRWGQSAASKMSSVVPEAAAPVSADAFTARHLKHALRSVSMPVTAAGRSDAEGKASAPVPCGHAEYVGMGSGGKHAHCLATPQPVDAEGRHPVS